MQWGICYNYKYILVLIAIFESFRYKNGKWEFNFSGEDIHEDLNNLGGIDQLKLKPSWNRLHFCLFYFK